MDFLFIVGCGHSGTTVIRDLFNAVTGTHVIPNESRLFEFPRYSFEVKRVLRQWEAAARADGASLIVEKTPQQVFHLQRIWQWLPNAKILGVVRDPRDVVASMLGRGRTVDAAVSRWCRAGEILKRVASDGRCRIMRYEDLVADPQQLMSELASFVGSEVHEALPQVRTRVEALAASGLESEPVRADHDNFRE
ncbi:MAG: sulfotransferase [Acidimicrobiales bacterium]|nr:sulfotransferase [Acidimicrobiales bacterium]